MTVMEDIADHRMKRLSEIMKEVNAITQFGWFGLSKEDTNRLLKLNNEILEIRKTL